MRVPRIEHISLKIQQSAQEIDIAGWNIGRIKINRAKGPGQPAGRETR
jgi:hypothetical protein